MPAMISCSIVITNKKIFPNILLPKTEDSYLHYVYNFKFNLLDILTQENSSRPPIRAISG